MVLFPSCSWNTSRDYRNFVSVFPHFEKYRCDSSLPGILLDVTAAPMNSEKDTHIPFSAMYSFPKKEKAQSRTLFQFRKMCGNLQPAAHFPQCRTCVELLTLCRLSPESPSVLTHPGERFASFSLRKNPFGWVTHVCLLYPLPQFHSWTIAKNMPYKEN